MIDIDFERTADTSDIATKFEMVSNDLALKAVQAKLAPEYHPDFDGVNCVECGEPIHPKRLAAGRVRCTECQEEIDLRGKQYAH